MKSFFVAYIETAVLAIRIFGIYSPTELQTKLWDAVGKQLARRGEEYKNRYRPSPRFE